MIALGSRVRDIITGVKGVAIGRTEWLYGCTRIAVEHMDLDKDGKTKEANWLDEQRIELIDGEPIKASPRLHECAIMLGSKVRDKLTGFDGIASGRTNWLSGNTTVTIEPTKLHDGKPIQAHNFDSARVELVEEQKPPMSKQGDPKAPGGPQNDPSIQ